MPKKRSSASARVRCAASAGAPASQSKKPRSGPVDCGSPSITFSTTVWVPMSCRFWKVRVMPSRALRLAGIPAMSVPAKRRLPLLAAYRPLITLISVLLPAPLGPISAWIVPARTVKLTSLTATTPA